MGKPAATLTHMHVCPKVEPGPVPHVGGPIVQGSPDVSIGGLPAARKGDKIVCVGPPDTINSGSSGVFINGKPAARMGDSTEHGGKIIVGNTTVIIGEQCSVLPVDIDEMEAKQVEPDGLKDAKQKLAESREKIKAEGYSPKYSDDELKTQVEFGNVANEQYHVRFMESKFLVDERNTPNIPLSGQMGGPVHLREGTGVKYWSTTFDQLEDADTDPEIICKKLGLTYDPEESYSLLIVDTHKAKEISGTVSLVPTFEKLGEFADEQLEHRFEEGIVEEIMTPEYQEDFNEIYNEAEKEKMSLWDPSKLKEFSIDKELSPSENKNLKSRIELYRHTGANEDFLGTGLTKNNNQDVSQEFGVVETYNIDHSPQKLSLLKDEGAISIIENIRPTRNRG